MGKELNLGYPILKCYSKGRMLSMILSQNRDMLPWLYYNNMQLSSHTVNEKGESFVIDICNAVAPFIIKEWECCPYIRNNTFNYNYIKEKYGKLATYIKECIDNNEYVYFCLNTSYVSAYDNDKYNENRVHDIFVCGYNDDQTFICYDYFGVKYEKRNIPFAEIETALLHLDESMNTYDYVNGIHSLLIQEPHQFSFFSAKDINRNHIIQKMFEIVYVEYSEVNNMMLRRENGDKIHTFGLNVYDELAKYFQKNSFNDFDCRPFYVIKDHLKIICDAIAFFDIPFVEESQEIYRKSNELAVYVMKEYLSHRNKNVDVIINKIMTIKNKEYELFKLIFEFYNYTI